MPETSASKTLSVSNCRTMRPRPAPTAERTAISRVRRAAFARSKLAMLAQAIQQYQAHPAQHHI